MTFFRRSRSTQARPVATSRNWSRPLHLERLDDRTVPANLVTAQLTGTTLTIIGLNDLSDVGVLNGDNNQVVVITGKGPGSFDVDVGGTSEFLLPGNVTSTATQSFKGVTSIKIDMRLGDDLVVINQANLSGELSFNGGNGNDTLKIGTIAGNQVFGRITINNGDGNDRVEIGNGSNKVLGDVRINNGVGPSTVLFNTLPSDELTIGGSLTLTNGDGSDEFRVGGSMFVVNGSVTISNGNGGTSTVIAPTSKALIFGSMLLSQGEGLDEISLGFNDGTTVGQFVVARGLSIQTTGGGSSISLEGVVNIQSKLDIQSANGFDSLLIGFKAGSSLTVSGPFNLVTGEGGSELGIQGSSVSLGSLTINNGPGFDNIQITPDSLNIGGLVSVTNGSGGSYVGLSPNGPMTLAGGAKITNGAGEDTLVLGGTNTTTLVSKGLTVAHGHGGSSTFLTAADATISGAVSIAALDGDDVLSFSPGKLSIAGGVTFTAGNGDAQAFLTPTTSQTLQGPVAIQNATGKLQFTYGQAGAASVSKGLSWTNGNGSLQVLVEGTVTVNGSVTGKAGEGFAKIEVPADLVAGTVSITNGAGGSDVSFTGSTRIAGALTINNSDGTDLVALSGSKFEVLGSASINQGVGEIPTHGGQTQASSVLINAGTSTFTGGLTVKALSGSDKVQFGGGISAKSLSIDLGADEATITVDGPLTIAGNLSVLTGSSSDTIALRQGVTVGGTTTIRTGAGDEAIEWAGANSLLNGPVTIDTGDGEDLLIVQSWTVKSATKITLGSGNDEVFIDNSILAAVFVDAGGGSDAVYVESQDLGGSTVFNGAVSILMGDGDDLIYVANPNDNDDFAVFNGAVNINGGNGLDQAFAQMDRFNVFNLGGTATNFEVLV